MNGTKKIKYSRTDQIILGIAYVFLGVFVLSILIREYETFSVK